jgi:hypothetical protein
MKKAIIVILVIVVLAIPVLAFAHSGGTDSDGGHTDKSTGEYHYHHGYSAHLHLDGVCPYDEIGQSNENYDESYITEDKDRGIKGFFKENWEVIACILLIPLGLMEILAWLYEKVTGDVVTGWKVPLLLYAIGAVCVYLYIIIWRSFH